MTTPRLPWDPDGPLESERAAAIIAALDARFRDADLRQLHGGWDFHTFLVDDTWVFRFPKREEVCAQLRKEWRVLDALTAVNLAYAVPNHVFRSEATERYPRPFSGYRICPGWPLIERHSRLTTGVDTFLEQVELISSLTVDAPIEPISELEPWAAHSRDRLGELGGVLGDHVGAAAAELIATSPSCTSQPIFQHNDLGPDHLLCIGGTVTAVIDWADACYADPAADVAGAAIAWGFGAVRSALSRGDDFWHRVRFRVALGAISMLWYGTTAERADYVNWGRRALEDVV